MSSIKTFSIFEKGKTSKLKVINKKMEKDGFLKEFFNSEIPINASLSVSTEYRTYRPLFYPRRRLGAVSIGGKIFIIFL